MVSLRLFTTGSNTALLQYNNSGSYTTLETIYGISNEENLFEFNIYIQDLTVNLRWFMNGVYNNSHSFDVQNNKFLINSIELYNIGQSAGMVNRLDYVGIYQNNVSIGNPMGYIAYYFGNQWDWDEQNLIYFNSKDLYRIMALQGTRYYFPYLTIPEYDELRDFETGSFFDNLYVSEEEIENSSLLLITNQMVDDSDISFYIEGVKIVEGSNEYLSQYFTNLNYNESYFRVSEGRLRFYAKFLQDDITEYLLMTVDIDNQITINRTFQTRTYYNGIGYGNVWVNFSDDTVKSYEIEPYGNQISEILNQEQIIDGFSISLTDNDANSFTDRILSGYTTDFILKYTLDIDISIITFNLITALIPFMIIFFPSVSMYLPLKKKEVGKVVFIVMFILLSIVCFTAELIPLWLLFVLMYALGFFFVITRRRKAF